MAPLNKETPLLSSPKLPHIGPPIPEVNSVWFKLYLYHKTSYGPPSLLLVRGKFMCKTKLLLFDHQYFH